MTIALRSRVLIHRLKPKFRLRTLMAFVALSAVWLAYESKVRTRWQTLADQAGMQEQLASCEEQDASVYLQFGRESEDRLNEANAMTPEQRFRRMISAEQIECWKSDDLNRRKQAARNFKSVQSRLEIARRLRKRWW